MGEILFSIGIFIFTYFTYLFFVIMPKKKLPKFMDGTEVRFLKARYHLKLDKVKPKLLANVIALANAFIISVTFLSIAFVNNYIFKLMIAFVVLVPLIFIVYHLISLWLRKKEC